MFHPVTEINKPKGLVKITITDSVTGKVVDMIERECQVLPDLMFSEEEYQKYLEDFAPNTATLDARRMLAELFSGNLDYAPTQIEWGAGSVTPQRSDSDLENPFSPRINTPITSFDFPTPAKNVVKITTVLGDITVPGGIVREICIRTNPILPDYPDGLMVTRYVHDNDLPKNSNRLHIGVEWIVIFN